MSDEGGFLRWEAFGHSVRGTSHEKLNSPNQDSLRLSVTADGSVSIMTLADGHGSPRCFRSHIGSRIATEIAEASAHAFLSEASWPHPDGNGMRALGDLAHAIASRWREEVHSHLVNNPITHEQSDLPDDGGPIEQPKIHSGTPPDHLITYGTTLLVVGIKRSTCFAIQIGDGDILTVTCDNSVRRMLPRPTEVANETLSLAMDNAGALFRLCAFNFGDTPPALIFASTDGYANSFESDGDFLKVGSDLLMLLRSKGTPFVIERLPLWLRQASDLGSGDDITVGCLLGVVEDNSNH